MSNILFIRMTKDVTFNTGIREVQRQPDGLIATDILFKLFIRSGSLSDCDFRLAPYSVPGIASATGHSAEEVQKALDALHAERLISILSPVDLFKESLAMYRMSAPDLMPTVANGHQTNSAFGNATGKAEVVQVTLFDDEPPAMSEEYPAAPKPKKVEKRKPSDTYPDSPEFPLKNGSIYRCTQDVYDSLHKTYPTVDIDYEFQRACNWLVCNPAKRKTRQGMRRFLGSWVANAESRYPARPVVQNSKSSFNHDHSKTDASGREVL